MATRLPTLKLDPTSVQALQAAAERPFYASVGATDLAVEAVREVVADVQTRVRDYRRDVRKNVASLDLPTWQPRALRDSAVTVPARVQSLVDANAAFVEGAYGDLVKRGETLVSRIRGQQTTQEAVKAAETTVAKARTTRTQTRKAVGATTKATAKKATSTAKKRSAAPRSSAKATTTSARKTASSAARATTRAAAKVGD